MRGFSGIRDIDMKILMDLEDEDLYYACQTDKRINDICNDEVFWMRKAIKSGNVVKPEDISWRRYYLSLRMDPAINLYEKIFYLKENAREFFKEANFGLYNGIPLNNNLTEIVGITSYKNLNPLFYHYFRLNNISKVYKVTDLMNKYFDKELTELEAEGKFDRNNFTWNKLFSIIGKLILKPLDAQTMKYLKMKDIIEQENDILSKLVNPKEYELKRLARLDELERERLTEQERLTKLENDKIRAKYENERSKKPFMSFEYFKYQMDPNSKESLEMKHEYDDRRMSYIQSFHQKFPNSPSDPQYPSFRYFDYDEEFFPSKF